MKASELRIGNYVAKVFSKDYEYFVVDHITILMSHNYERIPLDKKWLLDLGFMPNDNTEHSDSFYAIAVGGSALHVNPDNGVVWIYRDKGIFNNPCLIDSVHQLQNLYFALTGEELTIKE
jgi:hypothetical protein